MPETTFIGSNGTVLTGTDWVTQTLSFGQFVYSYDNEFITDTGALYDQHQLAPDFTNFYSTCHGSPRGCSSRWTTSSTPPPCRR